MHKFTQGAALWKNAHRSSSPLPDSPSSTVLPGCRPNIAGRIKSGPFSVMTGSKFGASGRFGGSSGNAGIWSNVAPKTKGCRSVQVQQGGVPLSPQHQQHQHPKASNKYKNAVVTFIKRETPRRGGTGVCGRSGGGCLFSKAWPSVFCEQKKSAPRQGPEGPPPVGGDDVGRRREPVRCCHVAKNTSEPEMGRCPQSAPDSRSALRPAEKNRLSEDFTSPRVTDTSGQATSPGQESEDRTMCAWLLGLRVVRGPDWKRGDEDGGEGGVGTVVGVDPEESYFKDKSGQINQPKESSPRGTVVVQWDIGTKANYYVGPKGNFSLRILDNAPAGVRHPGVSCRTCRRRRDPEETCEFAKDVVGIRWVCSICSFGTEGFRSFDLCSVCYMNNRHDLTHQFWRVPEPSMFPDKIFKTLMPPRSEPSQSQKISLRGILPGTRVTRGPDWNWKDQDGGAGKVGQVLEIQCWGEESGRSVASVLWSTNGLMNVYRVGHKGKVDLKVVSNDVADRDIDFSNGIHLDSYFPDHLPVLGRADLVAPNSSQPLLTNGGMFHVGDLVTIDAAITLEVFKRLQEGYGGFSPKMTKLLDRRVGRISRITSGGHLRVQFQEGNVPEKWTLNPAVLLLEKSAHLKAGDRIMILRNRDAVKALQPGHGEWVPAMEAALGKVGHILKVYKDGDVRVSLEGTGPWTFNSRVVRLLSGSSASTGQALGCAKDINDSSVQDNYDRSMHSDQEGAKPPNDNVSSESEHAFDTLVSDLHDRSQRNDWEKVKAIVEAAGPRRSDLVETKINGRTALHRAAHLGRTDVVRVLLEAGADPSAKDDREGDAALHFAALGGWTETLSCLLDSRGGGGENGADVNGVNLKSGTSALHAAVFRGRLASVQRLLAHPDVDVNLQDTFGDTPLHEALINFCPKNDHLEENNERRQIIEALICSGRVNYSLTNRNGFNVLHLAAVKGNDLAVSLILEDQLTSFAGNVSETKNRQVFVNARKKVTAGSKCRQKNVEEQHLVTTDGYTALHLACLNGHEKVVRLLLEKGKADRNKRDSFRGQTPLHLAVCHGHASSVEALLGCGDLDPAAAKKLVNLPNKDGETPLHLTLRREGSPSSEASSPCSEAVKTLAANARLAGVPEASIRSVVIAGLLIKAGATLWRPVSIKGHVPADLIANQSSRAFLADLNQAITSPKVRNAELPKDGGLPDRQDGQQLPKEVKAKKDSVECLVCSEDVIPVRFLPCSHEVACQDCSSRMKKCPICKKSIEAKVSAATKKDSAGTEEEHGTGRLMKDGKAAPCPGGLSANQGSGAPGEGTCNRKRMEDLKAKLKDMEEQYTCTICMERKKTVVFLCGHGACAVCVETLKSCHMCRGHIDKKINLY